MAVFRVCLLMALGVSGFTLTGAAAAEAPVYHRIPSKEVSWIRWPSVADFTLAYPPEAIRAHRGGATVLECLLNSSGGVDDCRILAETEPAFGQAALRIAPKFFFDTGKTAQETLAGAVVTIPTFWIAPGGSPPKQPPYMAAEPPLLITVPQSGGSVACPTEATHGQPCYVHELRWDKSPSLEETAPLVRTVQGGPTVTNLVCSVRVEFQLGPCEAFGSPTTEQAAAMDQMARLFTAPAAAKDKTPVRNGQILLSFHWQLMQRALDASHFTQLPKP